MYAPTRVFSIHELNSSVRCAFYAFPLCHQRCLVKCEWHMLSHSSHPLSLALDDDARELSTRRCSLAHHREISLRLSQPLHGWSRHNGNRIRLGLEYSPTSRISIRRFEMTGMSQNESHSLVHLAFFKYADNILYTWHGVRSLLKQIEVF
jgi:hypothetical protein